MEEFVEFGLIETTCLWTTTEKLPNFGLGDESFGGGTETSLGRAEIGGVASSVADKSTESKSWTQQSKIRRKTPKQ